MAADCECSSSTLCSQAENSGKECWATGGGTEAEGDTEDEAGEKAEVDKSPSRCSISSTFAGSVATSKASE